MDAAQAIADLTEISSQIESVVLLDGKGAVVGSTFSDDGAAKRFADAAKALLDAAERVREGGEALTQLEAETPEGSVFVLRDGDRLIAATTVPDPTVGLVFYDLKSALAASEAAQKPKRKPRARAKKTTKAATDDA
ncbi:MAG: roadblock/LC7 domain-containing protein [Actinomycetota bacterium]|nr:roadblock/LC7 domain-containing protein [Actinomycetota bacterium]